MSKIIKFSISLKNSCLGEWMQIIIFYVYDELKYFISDFVCLGKSQTSTCDLGIHSLISNIKRGDQRVN